VPRCGIAPHGPTITGTRRCKLKPFECRNGADSAVIYALQPGPRVALAWPLRGPRIVLALP